MIRASRESTLAGRAAVGRACRRGLAAAFGDRIGLAVFLGALTFFGCSWRVGFFITDNWTVANTLVAVADGHLHVDRIVYGPASGDTPGMHLVDGRLYGRNYGHAVAAVPFLWALEATAAVGDPRVVVAGAWSLTLLAFCLQVGALAEQRRAFALVGAAGALGGFAINVAIAAPLDGRWLALLAFQLVTMVAAAGVGVGLYRLLALFHGRRVGAAVAAAVVLGTPVGFWATIPKRHAVTALLATVALYGFAASRRAEDPRSRVRHRALAYVAVGLTAWVHAAEAFVLLLALVPLDLLTARSNDRRQLLVVGAAFAASLLPFLATNALISGNPLEPPRLLPSYNGQADALLAADGTSAGSAGGTPDGASGGADGGAASDPAGGGASSGGATPPDGGARSVTGLLRSVAAAVAAGGGAALGVPDRFAAEFDRGLRVAVDDPERVYRTFVRSGWLDKSRAYDERAINLTVLESAPVLGALVAAPALVRRRLPTARGLDVRRWSPRRATDLFAVAYVLLLTLLYLPRLPLNAQVTVRYLLPAVPMLGYALGRLPPVRRAVDGAAGWLVWTYAAGVLVGGQLTIAAVAALRPTLGEAMQLHALAGLAAAVLVAGWLAADRFAAGLDDRIGAAVLAAAAATGTIFVVLSGVSYFPYGDPVLAVARLVSRAVAI